MAKAARSAHKLSSTETADGTGGDEAGTQAPQDVGARLKELRRIYGLSQRELAKRAGVTNGTISLIEQGRTSPSVGSLKKVLDGFPISLADFFTRDWHPRRQIFFRAAELKEIAGGDISFRLVGDKAGGRKLQVMHECYQPGADTGADLLSHEGEEAGVIVSGTLEITVGGNVRVLSSGDAYSFDSRLPHRFRNVGEEPCVVVSACTPPSF